MQPDHAHPRLQWLKKLVTVELPVVTGRHRDVNSFIAETKKANSNFLMYISMVNSY